MPKFGQNLQGDPMFSYNSKNVGHPFLAKLQKKIVLIQMDFNYIGNFKLIGWSGQIWRGGHKDLVCAKPEIINLP